MPDEDKHDGLFQVGAHHEEGCEPCGGGPGGSTTVGSSGYNRPSRSISGRASGVLFILGSLTGWSHTNVVTWASRRSERIVDTQASRVSSVPLRRSSTRSCGFVGGGSVWRSAQQRSKIVVRRSCETLMVGRSAVHRADTKSTNWRSGMPGF